MTDSKFAVSDVSLGSQESEYTESSMASLMKMTFQLGSKETTQSQRINDVRNTFRVGSTIVKPQKAQNHREPQQRLPKNQSKLLAINATEGQRSDNNDYISENLGLTTSQIEQTQTENSRFDSQFWVNTETLNSQSEDINPDGPFETKEGIYIKDANVRKQARVPSLISNYNQ